MTEKISWNKFKEMPSDLQKEYIKTLRENHGGRGCDIAEMFGIKAGTYSAYVISKFPELKTKGSASKTVSPEWIKFINGEPAVGETLAEVNIPEEKQEEEPEEFFEEPKENKTNASLNLEQGSLILEGEPSLVFGRALMVFGKNKNYKFIINFKEVCDAD